MPGHYPLSALQTIHEDKIEITVYIMHVYAFTQNFPLTYAAWDMECVKDILYSILFNYKDWCCHNTYLASEIDGLLQ